MQPLGLLEIHRQVAARPARSEALRASDGLAALNSVIELMRGLGRPRGDIDMWEVAVWEDALAADEREVYLTFEVHNEAIVIPENVDCIRALTGAVTSAAASMEKTSISLGITCEFLPATAPPVAHVGAPDVAHPGREAARAA